MLKLTYYTNITYYTTNITVVDTFGCTEKLKRPPWLKPNRTITYKLKNLDKTNNKTKYVRRKICMG